MNGFADAADLQNSFLLPGTWGLGLGVRGLGPGYGVRGLGPVALQLGCGFSPNQESAFRVQGYDCSTFDDKTNENHEKPGARAWILDLRPGAWSLDPAAWSWVLGLGAGTWSLQLGPGPGA